MNKLREIREKKNLTQKQLGDMLGVGRSTVTLWENGKNHPRYDMLIKMSNVLGCSIEDLFCNE